MMDIDAAIIKYKEKAEFFKRTTNVAYGLELEQLVGWLEELKAIKSDGFTDDLLNMGFTKGYRKAIDEFVTKAYRRLGCSEKELYCSDVIDEIAEQMKKGE